MKIEACLFDLDGVLVDTAKYHYLAWKRLANSLGFDFTENQNEKLKGISREKSLEILLGIGQVEVPEDEKQRLMTKKNEWYLEYIHAMDKSEILPGSKDLIQVLKAKGVKVVLGSASRNARLILEKVGLIDLFDQIVDGNSVKLAKPHPEVFLMGSQSVGITPEHCVVFEDAEAGIEAAHRAGMSAIGVGSVRDLTNADYWIRDLSEISYEDIQRIVNV